MTRDEMSQLVDRILTADPLLKQLAGPHVSRHQIKAKSGATGDTLSRLSTIFPNGRLPPSYRMLLELHDGIDNFEYTSMSLLSADDILELGHDARTGYPEDMEPDTIFFIVGHNWEGVAFDTRTQRDDGEMLVADYSSRGRGDEWASLPEFLRWYLSWLEEAYAKALADRKGLED